MALTNGAALGGLTVLDLSRVLAGPWATQILGDLGADILKVERPGTGDETRGWGPPYLKDSNEDDSDRAAYFASANRNKRSIAIDMADPEGARLLRDLAAESDIVYQVFPTSDGHVVIAVGNDSQFQRLCAALDRPDLASDPAFATNRDRVGSRERLIPMLTTALASDTTASWVGRLEAVGVPCGPVNTMAGVFDDPHVKARGLALSLDDSAIGAVPGVASPLHLSRTPARAVSAPPALGADTLAVLRERLALDDAALKNLLDAGGIGGSGPSTPGPEKGKS